MARTLTAVRLFELGFGPVMVPVSPPGAVFAPSSTVDPADAGKAPAVLGGDGLWYGASSVTSRCDALPVAMEWDAWGANVGLRLNWIDNDYGPDFTLAVYRACALWKVPTFRRYVDHPEHQRDAFLFVVGEPLRGSKTALANTITGETGAFEIIGSGKQALAGGIHPGRMRPYLFDPDLPAFKDIPVLTKSAFETLALSILNELQKIGIEKIKNLSSARPVSGVASSVSIRVRSSVEDVKLWLQLVPNALGAISTALDDFLSVYENFIKVCYAIVGALGATPEARAIWLEWAHERTQKTDPERTFDSVAQAPDAVRLDAEWLRGLAKRFNPDGFLKSQLPLIPADEQTLVSTPLPGGGSKPGWARLRDEWVYVQVPNRYASLKTGRDLTRESFNSTHAHSMRFIRHELYGATPPTKPPLNRMSDIFDNQPDRQLASVFTYHPGRPRLFDDKFNLWQSPVFRRRVVTEADVQPYLDHLEYVLVTVEAATLFVKWLAFIAQHPDQKPNWQWLVITPPGVGKDTMAIPFRLSFGDANVGQFNLPDIHKDFNSYIKKKLLIVSEAKQHENGHSSKADFDKLKEFTAAPPYELPCNEKYLKPYDVPNLCGVILFSNEPNPLAIGDRDRRFCVVDNGQAAHRDAAYYEDLQVWLWRDGIELIANYLHTLALSPGDIQLMLGRAPETTAKTQLIAANKNPLEAALDELIEDARLGGNDFKSLFATSTEIAAYLTSQGVSYANPNKVGRLLVERAKRNEGVNPRNPEPTGNPGPILLNGKAARIWMLGFKRAEDGVDPRTLSNASVYEARQGKVFGKASVSDFPQKRGQESDV